MIDIPENLKLTPIDKIDVQYNCDAGEDNILTNDETGYNNLYAEADKNLKIGELSLKQIELLDTKKGFSPLERQIAHQFFEINKKHGEFICEKGFESNLNISLSTYKCYFNLLRHFYTDPVTDNDPTTKAFPLTEDYIQAITKTLIIGRDMAIDYSDLPENAFTPLNIESRNYILNVTSAVFANFADIKQLTSSFLNTDTLLSEQELLDDHLYGPIGYYATRSDHVFDKSISYESPVNILSPLYGKIMASYILNSYQNMIKQGLIATEEEFVIYEHGGGDGQLAIDVLGYAQKKAEIEKDKDWQDLWKNLRYVSVEIATPCIEMQKKIEDKFDKFKVIQGNAINWKPSKKSKGIVISVFLVDSFPPHLLYKNDGKVWVVQNIPTLICQSGAERDELFKLLFPDEKLQLSVKETSDQLKKECLGIKHNIYNHIYLNEKTFSMAQQQLAKLREADPNNSLKAINDFKTKLQFAKVIVEADKVPEVKTYLNNHPQIADMIPEEKLNFYVNTDLDEYIHNIAENYFISGTFLTVDVLYPKLGSPVYKHPPLIAQKGLERKNLDYLKPSDLGSLLLYFPPDRTSIIETFNQVSDNGFILPHESLDNYYNEKPYDDYKPVSKNGFVNDHFDKPIFKGLINLFFGDPENIDIGLFVFPFNN